MTPGRLLYLLQRDSKRGLSATWHDYFVSRKILGWRNPFAKSPPEAIPIHLLTGKDDWLLACWMIASWIEATGRNWRIVIHDDGKLPREGREAMAAMMPAAEFIGAEMADHAVAEALSGHPACREYRLAHPLARKIFDVPALTASRRFIILDSDILFFRRPDFILGWCARESDENWFNEDVAESLPISPEEVREKLGVTVWPRVNSGLCLLDRTAIDLDLCERTLRETSLLKGHIWLAEQSLFAICASARGQGGLLPPQYEVSLGPRARPDAIARHYVGAVRHRFYSDGMARLKGTLIR